MKLKGTVLALTAALAIGALAAPSASAEPTAEKSAEDLVQFLTKGKIKIGNRISYQFQCNRNCNATVTLKLKVPRVRAPANTASGSFTAGIPVDDGFKINGPLKKAIRAGGNKSKLTSTIKATDPTTGEFDKDVRTFKFK